ncbi:glycosyltransferase [Pontiellaceae bacterium B12219]|nr:glycosyltransferase [Pontiellaceae bacterium B12219]
MKVIHVNYSGSQGGGAAIAALRLHQAIQDFDADISSEYWCARPDPDQRTYCFQSARTSKLNNLKNVLIGKLLKRPVRSLNLFPTSLVSKLNASDADVINLHWINGEMVSIHQLGQLKKPVVWTMHDMWAFCGAEHYTVSSRYMDGYDQDGFKIARVEESEGTRGVLTKFDIDRWVYLRKERAWKNLNLHISTPSRWLADCSENSALMGHVPTISIPNCLDLDLFKPLGNKVALRREFNLPSNKKIILFGAVDPKIARKGGDLLLRALEGIKSPEKYALAVFGNNQGAQVAGMETHNVGSIYEPEKMARLYSCADVMCVPSRQDNLPNTCVEANACGLPIVAFNIGGIPDIVDHKQSGYLAEPFDTDDYCHGLEWILSRSRGDGGSDSKIDYDRLCQNAREKAIATYAPEIVASQYFNLYRELVGE